MLHAVSGAVIRTSTDTPARQFHHAKSLAQWNAVVDAAFHDISVISAQERFSGCLGHCNISSLELFRIRALSSQVRKRIHRGNAATSGTMLVHLQSKGTSINAQGKRLGRLRCGEAVLCDPDDDYSVEFESAYEMFVLKLPTALIAAHDPDVDLEDVTVQRLDVHRSGLLLAFLGAAWGQADCLHRDPDWCECVAQTSVDLLVRAIRQSDQVGMVVSPRDFPRTVLSYIRHNLTDPSLRTSVVAETLGVSSRTVQSVFERMATTTSAFILSERLRLAAQRLRGSHASITQVALDVGFNDPAYFSRCFHRAYGLTPREYSRR